LSNPPGARRLPADDAERLVAAVELHLQALGDALVAADADAVSTRAQALHRALAQAVGALSRARRDQPLPPELRRRLAVAGGQVAAQRESLARATAALDRAIDVLLPARHAAAPASLYGASGLADRASSGPGLQA
jgi:hypothetical protein